MVQQEKIEALKKAFKEGKPIQFHRWGSDNWWDDKNPDWDWDNYEYRVHPNSASPLDIIPANMYNMYKKYILIHDGRTVLKIADIESITPHVCDCEIHMRSGTAIYPDNVTFYDANGGTFRIDTYYENDEDRVKEECARVNAQLLIRFES